MSSLLKPNPPSLFGASSDEDVEDIPCPPPRSLFDEDSASEDEKSPRQDLEANSLLPEKGLGGAAVPKEAIVPLPRGSTAYYDGGPESLFDDGGDDAEHPSSSSDASDSSNAGSDPPKTLRGRRLSMKKLSGDTDPALLLAQLQAERDRVDELSQVRS